MSTDHVVVRKMRPIAECAEVIGLMPLECKNCGDAAHIGLPMSVPNVCALVEAFRLLYSDCKKEDQ